MKAVSGYKDLMCISWSVSEITSTITRAGMKFHYYRGDDGEIYFDDEPEGGKPE